MKKAIIIFGLGVLMTSAFFIRLENFKSAQAWSIDEVVYYRLSVQIQKGLSHYNTIAYAQELMGRGRELLPYFTKPLFKHPPLFTFLLASSLKFFGSTFSSAGYIPILFGVLMIPLTYWLGALLFDRRTAILASLFLWMDPVNIITSQKVWMDTTIAFFMLLALVFFVYGFKYQHDLFFILSGMASGFAVNTKYTGILIVFAICIYVCVYKRDLFRNKSFVFSLVLPFIMLIPWFLWNYKVYGWDIIAQQGSMHVGLLNLYQLVMNKLGLIIPLFIVCFSGLLLYRKAMNDISFKETRQVEGVRLQNSALDFISPAFAVLFVCVFLGKYVLNSLQFDFIPTHSWQFKFFHGEPSIFYFGRLIEFFLIYVFGIVALFTFSSRQNEDIAVLRISALILLIFFIAWGNYQSRYILGCLPFLLLLASNFILSLIEKTKEKKNFLNLLIRSFLILAVFYSVLKVSYLNAVLSYPHDFCYY